MRVALQQAWLTRGVLAWSLRPVSWLYGLLGAARRAAYRWHLFSSARLPVPVVVVGNVIAGGAGKTPVVIALARHLQSRGLSVGVLSRGWGRLSKDAQTPLEVLASSPATEVGDEPLLIHRATGAPVFVAARRALAGRALLARHPQVQVLICDDGLQHLALRRDVEICVFDPRGVGNGWLLPAGPLREPWPRRVDLVLRPDCAANIEGATLTRRLAKAAMDGHGHRVELTSLRGQPLTAIAGIANPQAFFDMLADQGLELRRTVALPDHHDFHAQEAWLQDRATPLLCTEKDAVKLWRLRPDALAVPLEIDVDAQALALVEDLVRARLSSPHGLQTA
jgi:tetraacyldisaccharide 4'-kinase